jgi:hypothetical protein
MKRLLRVTSWEKVSLWRRVPCAFGRVALLIAFLSLLIKLVGPPITIFYMARREARDLPGVRVAPKPLTDYSVSGAPGTTLSYFGYEFDLPWNTSFKESAFKKSRKYVLYATHVILYLTQPLRQV